MRIKIDKYLAGRLFVIFSFIIIPFGEAGILARLTFPDVILLFAIFILLGSKTIYNPKLSAPLIFVFLFLINSIFSLAPLVSIGEVAIFVFLLFSVLVVYNVYFENLKLLFLDVAVALTLSFVIGIYDFFAGNIGLPRLFSSRAPGEILSAFRNAGQAGAYVLIMLAILLPLKLSKLKNSFSTKEMRIINIGLISGLIFLLMSGKIAAYLGFFAGILFLNIMLRNANAVIATVLLSIFLGVLYVNLEDISPELNKRIQMKVDTRLRSNLDGSNDITEEGFIAENIKSSLRAFSDNPIAGSGLGGFTVKYGKHEVHSTYFKMIGEGGFLGIIAYSIFIFYIFRVINYRPAFVETSFQQQLLQYKRFFMPFFLGCMLSWSYTYHMRKREFWIMFSVLLIINSFLRNPGKTDGGIVKE